MESDTGQTNNTSWETIIENPLEISGTKEIDKRQNENQYQSKEQPTYKVYRKGLLLQFNIPKDKKDMDNKELLKDCMLVAIKLLYKLSE